MGGMKCKSPLSLTVLNESTYVCIHAIRSRVALCCEWTTIENDSLLSSIVVSENQFRARSSLSVISSTGSSTATTTAGAAATLPIDFGESLPPNLTTLVNKQFRLYRIKKTAEQMGANNGEWMDRWMGDLNCYVVCMPIGPHQSHP